jgi:hypothetical protein
VAGARRPGHSERVPENYFDARIARTYEARWPELFDPAAIDPVVSFLAGLAGSGAALELGIGTGRLAVPLGVAEGAVAARVPYHRAGAGRPGGLPRAW